MSTIITRTGKGSPLTNAEMDLNLTNLNSDKLEDITGESIGDLSDVNLLVAPTLNQTLVWNGTSFVAGEGFTQSDFNTAFSAKSTDNLNEGSTNLYFTQARSRSSISVSGDLTYDPNTGIISTQGLASSTTDDLSEGSTNLYYLDSRVDTNFATKNIQQLANVDTTTPSNGQVLTYDNATSKWVNLDPSLKQYSVTVSDGLNTVESFSAGTVRSVVYNVTLTNTSGYQSSQVRILHNNSTAILVESDQVLAASNPLGTFSAEYDSNTETVLFRVTTSVGPTAVDYSKIVTPVSSLAASITPIPQDLASGSGTADMSQGSGTVDLAA
jgi:hypothetical protein